MHLTHQGLQGFSVAWNLAKAKMARGPSKSYSCSRRCIQILKQALLVDQPAPLFLDMYRRNRDETEVFNRR